MKIYISGKIGFLPKEVYEKRFNQAEARLAEVGWDVINPIKLDHSSHDKSWASYMLKDLEAMIPCDAVFMLSNWTDSPGAQIEHSFAIRMGKQIFYQNGL